MSAIAKKIGEYLNEGWISVEDRLPKDGDTVDAKYDGVYAIRSCITFWNDFGGRKHFGHIDEHDGKGSQPATHWRLSKNV